jgi:hypothetical protein
MEPQDIPHVQPLRREHGCAHGSTVAMAQGPSLQEDSPMLHAVHYPRDLIVDRVRFTPTDQAQIAQCRGAHNRLGFAYQLGFLRLTGRFPAQQPLELLDGLLVFVAQEVALDPVLIQDYAQRRQTVSEHQQLLALYLGFRPFGPAERDVLGHFVRDEALRLESTPALVAQAEAFLRDHHILVPASSTLQRVVGEQRALARQQLYVRLLACLPSSMPADLDALVQVEETPYSPLHALKAPPGLPSPRALLRLIAKLDQIQATQVLTLDLAWLNANLQKALAQHVWHASAHRLRGLPAPQRYTVLVGFLTQIYRDTLDQLVDMYSKVVTATYRRAQHDLDTAVKQHRPMFRDTLQSFQTIGQMLFDDTVAPDALRTTVFQQIPPERLQRQLQDAHQWLTGDTTDVLPLVMKRYSYFRQFAPSLLAHFPVALEATDSPALPFVTPTVIQASMAPAVAPVNGNGDKYQSWCPARYARVSNALILQSPTNNRPGVFKPTRIRSMIGMYKPSSARSPDNTSVDSGIPKGSNDPIMTLIWGRVGSSLLWPNCTKPSSVTS